MNRRYAVLRQFQLDLGRLILSVDEEFRQIPSETPDPEAIMRIYRPVHSLKGLCSMVDEGKDLAKIFHVLEDTLSEMLPVGEKHRRKVQGWRELVVRAVEFGKGTMAFVDQKMKLWERFGAHENENRGLIVSMIIEGQDRSLWIPITSLSGHFPSTEAQNFPDTWTPVGDALSAKEALLVEFPGMTVLVHSTGILSIATRIEALQKGVPLSLKEFLTENFRKIA